MINYIKKKIFNYRKKQEIKRLANNMKIACDHIYKNYTFPTNLHLSLITAAQFASQIRIVQLSTFNQDAGRKSITVKPNLIKENGEF